MKTVKTKMFGYARVSTLDQDPSLQIDALKAYGCDEADIFIDYVSGAKAERKELSKIVDRLREGDTIIIWKLDRLGRSTKHLLELSQLFKDKGVDLVSIQDKIDTSTAMGKFYFTIMGGIAELERDIIRERTLAGLKAARARGRKGGRTEKLSDKQVRTVRTMYANKEHSVSEICKAFNISRPTLHRYLKKAD